MLNIVIDWFMQWRHLIIFIFSLVKPCCTSVIKLTRELAENSRTLAEITRELAEVTRKVAKIGVIYRHDARIVIERDNDPTEYRLCWDYSFVSQELSESKHKLGERCGWAGGGGKPAG